MADASADPRIGMVIEDRYKVLDRIASGGMGVVYRAERLQLGRTVAVKFLDAANAADETSRARFEREAKAMSRLSHPHCVSVIDFGVADTPFIVMDYVTGQPLLSLIHTKKKVKATRAVSIMKQVMAGLAHAHRHDVIHRDVKPANIMLTEATGTGDFVRILDFGLAKLRGDSSLSSANIVVGTPSYMSPEQGSGKSLDARSDIYSAGVVLYELLSGDKPFVGEDAFETLRLHQNEPAPMLSAIRGGDEIRVALDAVIQKALAKKPKDRYQTALAMGNALARIEETNRESRPSGKRGTTKDPARATTLLPTKKADETEILAGSTSMADGGRSFASGFFRTVLLMALLGAGLYAAWVVWGPAKRERVAATSPQAAVAADAATPTAVLEPDVEPKIEPAAIDAAPMDAPSALDASVLADAAADASVASDASTELVAVGTDAGLGDAAVGDSLEVDEEKAADKTPPPVGPPRTAAEVRALADAGRQTEAIRGLYALIKGSPKNGYLHRTMGDLNVRRGWWSEALKNYRSAVRLTPRYKRFRSINENAIRALGFPKVRRAAERFIRYELGSAATPYLRSAARNNPSPTVRKRAAWLLKRIR